MPLQFCNFLDVMGFRLRSLAGQLRVSQACKPAQAEAGTSEEETVAEAWDGPVMWGRPGPRELVEPGPVGQWAWLGPRFEGA